VSGFYQGYAVFVSGNYCGKRGEAINIVEKRAKNNEKLTIVLYDFVWLFGLLMESNGIQRDQSNKKY
jgi:hypothetical protein